MLSSLGPCRTNDPDMTASNNIKPTLISHSHETLTLIPLNETINRTRMPLHPHILLFSGKLIKFWPTTNGMEKVCRSRLKKVLRDFINVVGTRVQDTTT